MMEGGKNTGMCQQLRLPGAEIVKALHRKRANAQMKPHSFQHLLVDYLKVYQGHKIRKSLFSTWPTGGVARKELPKGQLAETVTEVAKLGMFGYRESFVHTDLNFCPVQTGCLHVPSPSPSDSFTAYPFPVSSPPSSFDIASFIPFHHGTAQVLDTNKHT